ncbi:MAG: hypothetical protein WC708_11265 [Lentisphaeria bacterium]
MAKEIIISHESGNTSPRVTAALHQIVPGEETVIRFEPGSYRFDPEGTTTKEVLTAHLTKGPKHVVFELNQIEKVTIDGNGAEFLFSDRMFPFALWGCRDVTLKNFTIDFTFPRYCQGEVIASDEIGFELAIDNTLFKITVDGAGHVHFWSGSDSFCSTQLPILLGNVVFGKPPWDYVFSGADSLSRENLPTGYIETDAVATAQGVRFNYRKDSRKLVFPLHESLIFCYEPRANINILAARCKNVRVENVKIYRGGGMGIVAECTENFTADGVKIKVRPGRTECRSTTADGMFFTQCSGTVMVRNCEISETLDDALNIHGFYTMIQTVKDERTLRIVDGYEDHCGTAPFEAGDLLVFSDHATDSTIGQATTEEITVNADGSYTVRFTEPLPKLEPGDFIENETRSADFFFENNLVFRCPHMRVSDNGKRVIRNNHIEELNSIFVCDLVEFWRESGAVNDLLIENNDFIHCPRGGESPAVVVTTSRRKTSNITNHNVRIRNNHFVISNGRAIQLTRVEGGEVIGNHFSAGSLTELIKLEENTGIDCRNNQLD